MYSEVNLLVVDAATLAVIVTGTETVVMSLLAKGVVAVVDVVSC